jgi:hypothetical protein
MTTLTLDRRFCRAHNRLGDPCGQRPIRGGVVCVAHGGRAPQVKRAAQERLRELIDPAIVRLEELIHDEISSVALAAVKDVLDRNGYKATEKVEATLVNAFTLKIDRGSDENG